MNKRVDAGAASNGSRVFAGLDADWTAVCVSPVVRAEVRAWLVADGLLDRVGGTGVADYGPDDLLAVLRPRRSATGGQDAPADRPVVADRESDSVAGLPVADGRHGDVADAVLRSLLRRAAGEGHVADWAARLAARAVVQAMLPAAVRIARSQIRSYGGRSFDEVAHITTAALFEVARTARIHNRPGRPAANLTLDTLKRVCRELAHERTGEHDELPAAEDEDFVDHRPGPGRQTVSAALLQAAADRGLEPDAASDPAGTSTARLELLDLLLTALRHGALDVPDAQAIAWHHREPPVPDTTAARTRGMTPAAWRRRRSRAVRRLAALASV